MDELSTTKIVCPYCGEMIELIIDCSVDTQKYVEDCQVCCRPMHVSVEMISAATPHVEAHREDD